MLGGEDNEKGEKTTIGLISKKATFTRAVHFFVYFIAVALHDYNVKLPETSWLHVLGRKCRMCFCYLFSSWCPLASHRHYNIFMFFIWGHPNRVIEFPGFDSKLPQARNTYECKQAKRCECLPCAVSEHSI